MRRVLRPTTAIPMARNAATTSQRKAIHPHGPLRRVFTRPVLPIPPYVPAGRSGRVPDTVNHGRTNRLPSSSAAPATTSARPPAEIALIPAMARTRRIASNTFRHKCPPGRIDTPFVDINALWRPRPSTPFGTLRRSCAKREIGIELSLQAGGEHRPDLSGGGRVRRRALRSYANVVHRRGSLDGLDGHVRLGAAVPGRRRVLGTRHRGGPELVLRLSSGHVHQRLDDVLRLSGYRDLPAVVERWWHDVGSGPSSVNGPRPRLAVRSADQGRLRRDGLRRLPPDGQSPERAVQIDRPRGHVVRPVDDERRAVVQRQADPPNLPERPRRLRRGQRQARIICGGIASVRAVVGAGA